MDLDDIGSSCFFEHDVSKDEMDESDDSVDDDSMFEEDSPCASREK